MKNQEVLNVLNNLDILEQSGGEEPYALVEINGEVEDQLNSVGISIDSAKKYGDDETFCILALAFSEGYAIWYDGDKLHLYDTTYHDIALKGLKELHKNMIDTPKEVSRHSEWLSGFGAAIDYLEENY